MIKPSQVKAQLKTERNQNIKIDLDAEATQLDQGRIDEHSMYGGLYAIITNQADYITEEVVDLYGGLWQIEESFCVSKTNLMANPVYVWTDPHIEGHFAYCYLSLCLLRYGQYLLKSKLDLKISARSLWNP